MIQSIRVYPMVIDGTIKKHGSKKQFWRAEGFASVSVKFTDGTEVKTSTEFTLVEYVDTKRDVIEMAIARASIEGSKLVAEIINKKLSGTSEEVA